MKWPQQDFLIRFFEESLLLAGTSMELVPEMSFLFFSNADIVFVRLGTFIWGFYNTAEIPVTTTRVQLIDNYKFAKAALDKNSGTFVIHVAALEISAVIHPSQAARIAALQWDKAPTYIPTE